MDTTVGKLKVLAEQLQADPSKHAAHATELLKALQGDNEVS